MERRTRGRTTQTDSRSQRTRASRRGRHRVSTDSKSIVQNGVPDCVLHNRIPLCPVPANTRRTLGTLLAGFSCPETRNSDEIECQLLLRSEAEAVLRRPIRRCWRPPRLCDSYNRRRLIRASGLTAEHLATAALRSRLPKLLHTHVTAARPVHLAAAFAQTQQCACAEPRRPRGDRIPGERSSRRPRAGDAFATAAVVRARYCFSAEQSWEGSATASGGAVARRRLLRTESQCQLFRIRWMEQRSSERAVHRRVASEAQRFAARGAIETPRVLPRGGFA